jgi:hypothetical protein
LQPASVSNTRLATGRHDSLERPHIHACSAQDLETRKRAPLYQKKQEEEMRAASDKAAEAELRAQEAEIKYKEAKVRGAGVG